MESITINRIVTDDTRTKLTRFINEVGELAGYEFYRKLDTTEQLTLTFSWQRNEGATLADNNPSREEAKAVACTARLLGQDNDSISFNNMSKLTNDPGVSQGWKDCFAFIRDDLHAMLAEPTSYLNKPDPLSPGATILEINPTSGATSGRLTIGEIFDTIMYGSFVHLKPAKEARIAEWKKNPIAWGLIYQDFNKALFHFIDLALQVVKISKMELKGEHIPPPDEWDGGDIVSSTTVT